MSGQEPLICKLMVAAHSLEVDPGCGRLPSNICPSEMLPIEIILKESHLHPISGDAHDWNARTALVLRFDARIGCIAFAPVRQPYHPHFLSYEFTRPDVAAASGSNLPTDSEDSSPIDWDMHNTVACLSPMHALRALG